MLCKTCGKTVASLDKGGLCDACSKNEQAYSTDQEIMVNVAASVSVPVAIYIMVSSKLVTNSGGFFINLLSNIGLFAALYLGSMLVVGLFTFFSLRATRSFKSYDKKMRIYLLIALFISVGLLFTL